MNLQKCILTNNDCYRYRRTIVPIGIVVHSTGANNPNLKRYIQPDDGKLGKNLYGNHWNTSGLDVCVNAFIGKLKDNTIATYQTLPWNCRPWGCGSGKNGSYNNSHIQFEICEDCLTDASYFNKVYKEAVELCAYLVKQYPSINIENIVCHSEAAEKGYASFHSDVMHWFPKHGKSMDMFRDDVRKELGEKTSTKETNSKAKTNNDAYKIFVGGVQRTCGAKVDYVAGSETLSKTVTVSSKKNRTHKVVGVIQTYLNSMGYNCGAVDCIAGSMFDSAVKKFQKDNGCTSDGEITAKCKTWKKLLRL